MPIQIEFEEFTDSQVLFASKEATNAFFGAITVPDATEDTPGVVSLAANIPILVPVATVYEKVTILNADGSQTVATVVTKEAFDQLYTAFQLLLANLKAANIMVGDA